MDKNSESNLMEEKMKKIESRIDRLSYDGKNISLQIQRLKLAFLKHKQTNS